MTERARPEKLARPNQLTTLTQDQLVAALLRLAMEITVLRERLATHEDLLVEHGVLKAGQVDQFEPVGDGLAARKRAASELIDKLMTDLSE